MPYTKEIVNELHILSLFNLETTQEGLKVHSNAGEDKIAASKSLFDKGLITQPDGGYLTPLGHEAAEHAQSLLGILKS